MEQVLLDRVQEQEEEWDVEGVVWDAWGVTVQVPVPAATVFVPSVEQGYRIRLVHPVIIWFAQNAGRK